MACLPSSDSIGFSLPHRVPLFFSLPPEHLSHILPMQSFCLAASLLGPFHVNYVIVLTTPSAPIWPLGL